MLRPPKTRDLDRPVLISVESSVPKDHFYRHLHRALDLSFVRDLAADRYAVGGRPSIDPDAVAMKSQGQKATLGFHDHYAIDGDKARIILHAMVTPADVMENQPMLTMLRRVLFR